MPGYVFISNSTKPTLKEQKERTDIKINNFSKPCIENALRLGYNVFLGINREKPEELKCSIPINLYDSHTYRSIFDIKSNIIALNNLLNLIKSKEIKVIHCNTPVGGLIGRIGGKIGNVDKIIYTAHGFHFFKGASIINNIVFKNAERIMARWTDVIITINEEDYIAAKKFKLKNNGKVYKVHGVGIDLIEYENIRVDNNKKREELRLEKDDIILISMGDLVKRKNYSLALNIIAKCNNSKIKYLICGKGPELEKLKIQAKKLGIENQVKFLGFRTDIKELLKISDIFLFTTKQEGLPRSLMEAMASGLPCIVSNIRGNIDLLDKEKGGFLYDLNDIDGFVDGITKLCEDNTLKSRMSLYNLDRIKEYDIKVVEKEIYDIYCKILN